MQRIPEGITRTDWQVMEAVDEGGVKYAAWKLRIHISTVYKVLKRRHVVPSSLGVAVLQNED